MVGAGENGPGEAGKRRLLWVRTDPYPPARKQSGGTKMEQAGQSCRRKVESLIKQKHGAGKSIGVKLGVYSRPWIGSSVPKYEYAAPPRALLQITPKQSQE